MSEILIHKQTGALVSVDTEVQREMALLQGHRPMTADEAKEAASTPISAASATGVDRVPDDGLGEGSAGGPPPRTGTGSGRSAWSEYAAANHVTVSESATRDEIVELVAAAGVPTE